MMQAVNQKLVYILDTGLKFCPSLVIGRHKFFETLGLDIENYLDAIIRV